MALVALELGFSGLGGSPVGFGCSTGGLRWPLWHLSWVSVALVALELGFGGLGGSVGGLGGLGGS